MGYMIKICPGLAHHLTILRQIVVGNGAAACRNCFAVTDTGNIIGVTCCSARTSCTRKLTAILPSERPACTVIPVGGVADGIVADAVTTVGGQQIQPLAVAIGVGVGRCTADTADVAVGVVGVVIGSAGVDFLGQLPLLVVRVGGILICPSGAGNCRDVAALSVCIVELKFRETGAAVPLGVVNGRNLGGLVAALCAAGGLDLRHPYCGSTSFRFLQPLIA